MEAKPIVSVGVFIIKDDCVLLGRRLGTVGAGEWGIPGGKLDFGETLEAAAARELAEEVGVDLTVCNLRPLCVANIQKYGQHYLFFGFTAEWSGGEPQLMEPAKCAGWSWHPLSSPPEGPMTIPAICLEAYRSGEAIKYFPLVS